jgi:hypothetical protein
VTLPHPNFNHPASSKNHSPQPTRVPRAFGFDGDKSYYESLRDKVLADEAAKTKATKKQPNRAARAFGLPENEHGKPAKDPERKKSVGEKVMKFLWNGNRSEEEIEQMSTVGWLKDRKAGQGQHGTPEIVGEEHASSEIVR